MWGCSDGWSYNHKVTFPYLASEFCHFFYSFLFFLPLFLPKFFFLSPFQRYPPEGTYPNNVVCEWTFSRSHPIKFTFSTFDMEDHGSCSYDSLQIRTTPKRCGAKWKGGREGIFNTTTEGGQPVKMTFVSDGDVTKRGFVMHILSWKCPSVPKCPSGMEGGSWAHVCSSRGTTYGSPCHLWQHKMCVPGVYLSLSTTSMLHWPVFWSGLPLSQPGFRPKS